MSSPAQFSPSPDQRLADMAQSAAAWEGLLGFLLERLGQAPASDEWQLLEAHFQGGRLEDFLAIANCHLVSGAHAPVGSLRQGWELLGLDRFVAVLLAAEMLSWCRNSAELSGAENFWAHWLGCALVSQAFAQRLGLAGEQAFAAGLVHDLGQMANARLLNGHYAEVVAQARNQANSLDQSEHTAMGFTHCDSGALLARQWNTPAALVRVIEAHHQAEFNADGDELTAVVSVADQLCRLCGLGYGFYEARQVDMTEEAAWQMLAQRCPALRSFDLARFTFEISEYAAEARKLAGIASTEE